jgi:ATP-grasp domain, R2K clade family 3
MFWVVQENVANEEAYQSFVGALDELALPYTIVKVVPFSRELIPDVNPTNPVISWGSVSMENVAVEKGWKPGTFFNDNFDQRVWTKVYGDDMLNADAEFHEFCKIPAFEGTRFIRPVEDKKVFAGMVVHGEEIENWKEAIQRYSDGYTTLRPETVVGVSNVKEIAMEWRFFVVGGKVVTGSRYKNWGLSDFRRVDETTGPWEFAQKMVDKWQPADAFVIDIASPKETPEKYKMVEINCINAAGFYCSDVRAIIEAIEAL